MELQTTRYGFGTVVSWPLAEAVERITAALKAEGFGVLTTIDVQATLKHKLGIDSDPYVILGACNPRLAHQALEAEPQIGLLLPCNVVVAVHGGQTTISALDPVAALGMSGNPALAPIAREARQHLQRAVAALADTATCATSTNAASSSST